MKLWIDDVRAPPDSSWTWAKDSTDALALLQANLDSMEAISFDHDLGGEDTSRAVAAFLEEHAFYKGKLPIGTRIHSANPVGREWLEHALSRSTWFVRT